MLYNPKELKPSYKTSKCQGRDVATTLPWWMSMVDWPEVRPYRPQLYNNTTVNVEPMTSHVGLVYAMELIYHNQSGGMDNVPEHTE